MSYHLIYFGLIPVAGVFWLALHYFFKIRRERLRVKTAGCQFWLQDLLVAAISLGVAMLFQKEHDWLRFISSMALMICGMSVSLNIVKMHRAEPKSVWRAAIFGVCIATFVIALPWAILGSCLIMLLKSGRKLENFPTFAVTLIGLVYCASFVLPFSPGLDGIFGWRAYLLALESLLTRHDISPASFSWFANPVFWIALLLIRFRQWDIALLIGLIGFLISLLPFTDGFHFEFVEPAYHTWLSSMLLSAIAAGVGSHYELASRYPLKKSHGRA